MRGVALYGRLGSGRNCCSCYIGNVKAGDHPLWQQQVLQLEGALGIDLQRVRELALGLPEATEVPHHDRQAFRTSRKIFATLSETKCDLNLMLSPELQTFYCEQEPACFEPLKGKWGSQGSTRCDLAVADEETLLSALTAAHQLAS